MSLRVFRNNDDTVRVFESRWPMHPRSLGKQVERKTEGNTFETWKWIHIKPRFCNGLMEPYYKKHIVSLTFLFVQVMGYLCGRILPPPQYNGRESSFSPDTMGTMGYPELTRAPSMERESCICCCC